MIFGLAIKSLRNRRFTAALTVASIALSVLLLLGVERVRVQARESFASTIAGTDLVVGARSSPVHLLLYSVFRIGNATNNVSWNSYRAIAERPEVAWTIPLSLGDSHRGFRVLGTNQDYFQRFRFARERGLILAQGKSSDSAHEAVLGAEVAEALGYKLGQSIVIAHGAGDVSFVTHREHPFQIVGILAPTGTPVDRTVHVTLEGLDAIHAEHNAPPTDPLAAAMQATQTIEQGINADTHDGREAPQTHPNRVITAFLVGLKSRGSALAVQRLVNEYAAEPLTAILPGQALQEVWEIVGAAEKTLLAVSALVVIVGLAGMLVALLTGLSERRREMAVLRSVGARPAHVLGLILGEAAFLTLSGIVVGVAGLYVTLLAGQHWLESRLGLLIEVGWPSAHELILVVVIALAGVLIGLIPAYRVYRYSLADGMTIRV